MARDGIEHPPGIDEGPSAKPKVLRRPAQFARKSTLATLTEPAAEVAAPLAAAPRPAVIVHPRGWQDDISFGMALIMVVVAVNFLFAFTLPHLLRSTLDDEPSAVEILGSSALPSALSSERASGVTLYSEPEVLGDSGRSMDLETLPAEHNEFTVDPGPAPTARALND